MSDLEATGSRGQTTASINHATQISRLAQGKLRSLASGGAAIAENEGLLDAFAEVFARMAVAAPPPTEQAASNQDEVAGEVSADDSSDQGQQETTDQVESYDSADNKDVKLDPVVVTADTEVQTVEVIENKVQVESTDAADDLSDDGGEQVLDTNLDKDQLVVQVQTSQTEVVEQETETPEAAAVQFVVAENDGRKRDSRRDGQAVQQVDGPEIVHRHDEKGSQGPALESAEIETDPATVGFTAESGEDAGDDSDGRSRRHRRDNNTSVDPLAAKNHSSDSAAKTRVESALGVENEGAGDLATTPTAPEPPPAVRRAAASAITGAQLQPLANASQANSFQNGGGPRSSGAGITAAIDPAAPAKSDSKPKTAKSSQDHTSEAVTRAKLIQRVSKAFQHLGPEGGVVRLRLAPAEMGTVRVDMRINGRKVNARVVAETEAASSILREHLPDLRSRLESFGMQVERIEIETEAGEPNLGGQFDNSDRGNGWSERRDNESSQQFVPRTREVVSQSVSRQSPSPSGVGVVNASGGVDLKL